jgi:acetolactate synthase-1/2/3 large subunit
MNRMPLTSLDPAPDYTMIAAASRAHVERVATGAELAPALARALAALAEGRQALLDVRVALSERY